MCLRQFCQSSAVTLTSEATKAAITRSSLRTSAWLSDGDKPSPSLSTWGPAARRSKHTTPTSTSLSTLVRKQSPHHRKTRCSCTRVCCVSWFRFFMCTPAGPLPKKESDTKVSFPLSDSTVDTEWSASATHDRAGNKVSLTIMSSPNAPIGLYSLTVDHHGQKTTLGQFTLLFNAWCPSQSSFFFFFFAFTLETILVFY